MANGLMVDPHTGVVYDTGAPAVVPVAAPTVQATGATAYVPATRPSPVRPVSAAVVPNAPAGLAYTPEGEVMLDPGDAPIVRQRAAYTPAAAEGGGVDRIGQMIQDAAGRLWAQVSAIPSALGLPSRDEVRQIANAEPMMPVSTPVGTMPAGLAWSDAAAPEAVPVARVAQEPVDIVAANAAMPFGDYSVPSGGFVRQIPEDATLAIPVSREPVDIVAANAAMPFGDVAPAPTGGFASRLPEGDAVVLPPIVVSAAEAAEAEEAAAEEPVEEARPQQTQAAPASAPAPADNRPRPTAAGPARPQSEEEQKVAALVQMYEIAASAGFLDTERTGFKDFVTLFRNRTAEPEPEAAPQGDDTLARQMAHMQGLRGSSEGMAGVQVTPDDVRSTTPAPEPAHRTVQSAPQPMNTEADARGA